MINVVNHFQHNNRAVTLADANRRKWFIAAREDKERKDQVAEQSEQAFVDFAASVIVATEIEIQTFQAKLDTYDEATVIALIENREALDAVRTQLNDMLSRAHVLEDGRRVFKTEDGKRVFDEHGEQLDEAIIHPDTISDDRPTWESYSKSRDLERQLQTERQALIEYQEKLDNARERSNADDFTKEELDDLDAELVDAVPPLVKKHVPGFDAVENAPAAKTAFTANADPRIPQAPANPSISSDLQL